MLRPERLLVSVSSSRDVEVALHLVEHHASKYPAAISIPRMALNLRCLGPLVRSRRRVDNIVDMLLSETLIMSIFLEPLISYDTPIGIVP